MKSNTVFWLIGSIAGALALVVRNYKLGDVNYWFDETFSIRMSEFPIPEMVQRCAADTHPPLFFLCLKPWIAMFGTSPFAVRSLSLLFSTATVLAAFGFVFEASVATKPETSSRSKAILAASLAAVLLALSPLQLTWAHQVRMYSLAGFLSLFSTWMLWRALQCPESKWRWWILGIAEILAVYTHVTMLFVVAVHCAELGFMVLKKNPEMSASQKKSFRMKAIITAAVICVAGVPWFLVVRSQHARVRADFWSEPFEWTMVGDTLVRCFGMPESLLAEPVVGYWIGQGLVLILLVVAMGRRRFDVLLVLSAAAPFVGVIFVSIFDRNILNVRYFIAGQSLVLVAIGVLISRIPMWPLRWGAGVGVVGFQVFLASTYFGWRSEAAEKPGIPGLLHTWQEIRSNDEPLVFCSTMFYLTSRVYHENSTEMKVFGDQSRYPFFVGTAVMSGNEYISVEEIDRSEFRTIWACDFAYTSPFVQSITMSDQWHLVAERSVPEFNGAFLLRRYDRIEPVDSN